MDMNDQTDAMVTPIFWGPPLSGKTVLASQFPKPFFIALDPHVLTSVRALKKKYDLDFNVRMVHLTDDPTDDPDYIERCGKAFARLSGWDKVKKLTNTLLNSQKQLGPDETLVIDNLSRIGELLLRHIKKETGRTKLQIQDWGTFVEEILEFIEYFSSTSRKCNAIIIGHEEYHKDELNQELYRLLLMPTKMRHRIPSLATDFFYMKSEPSGPPNKRKVIRKLRSVPDEKTSIGSRILVPDIEYPSYAKLKPYIESAIGRELPEPNWTPPVDE